MSLIFMIAMAVAAEATPTVTLQQRDDDAVAMCKLRLDDGRNEKGDKLFLGWQFDTAKAGQIARDTVRIHDPNSLLGGRTFENVQVSGTSLTFMATDPVTADRKSAVALGLVPIEGAPPGIYTAVISVAEAGKLNPRYSGTCSVKGYKSGSNLMFDTLASVPAKEPVK